MELKLDEKECEKILLEWAQREFPAAFDTVKVDISYSSFRGVEFTKRPPADGAG